LSLPHPLAEHDVAASTQRVGFDPVGRFQPQQNRLALARLA
jgi:hypothetical protein